MAIRRLLAFLSGAPTGESTLHGACTVARRLSAHLDGIFLRPDPRDVIPMLSEGVTGAWLDDFIGAAERDIAERELLAAEHFDRITRESGLRPGDSPGTAGPSARRLEMTGRAEDFAAHARLYDLVIFGPGARNYESRSYAVLEACLMHAGRPLLLAPSAPIARLGERIAIAWNGGRHAARAVASALPFIEGADAVHVLTLGTPRTREEAGEELAEYLRWHGTNPEVHRHAAGAEPVGNQILSAAARLECDLLVLGGFGHPRLTEVLLGGVTRTILGEATLPVLIAH